MPVFRYYNQQVEIFGGEKSVDAMVSSRRLRYPVGLTYAFLYCDSWVDAVQTREPQSMNVAQIPRTVVSRWSLTKNRVPKYGQ